VSEAWAEIGIERQRTLLYSPRFGRLYLLPVADARDASFLRLIGLDGAHRTSALADPVARITHDRASLNGRERPAVPVGLRFAHWLMRVSRHVLPLRVTARLCRRWARVWGARGVARGASASEIGCLLSAIETRAGTGDCYARALLTIYLGVAAGRSCVLTVGVLAPTRKMHAWCSIDGELPYEPTPEHYLYQPVWSLALAP
jgi:hypothetical protein